MEGHPDNAGFAMRMADLAGDIPGDRELEVQQLSTLPMRMGGLGLRSGTLSTNRLLGIKGEALPMISRRNPEVASEVVRRLDKPRVRG